MFIISETWKLLQQHTYVRILRELVLRLDTETNDSYIDGKRNDVVNL